MAIRDAKIPISAMGHSLEGRSLALARESVGIRISVGLIFTFQYSHQNAALRQSLKCVVTPQNPRVGLPPIRVDANY